ncbi:MAG: hypothetical protein WCL59_05800 [Cyanobium sp. ELA507]
MKSPSATGTTVEFSQAARLLAREARQRRLVAPSFRCPPRVVGVQRTVRRHAGGAVVAVQLAGFLVALALAPRGAGLAP